MKIKILLTASMSHRIKTILFLLFFLSTTFCNAYENDTTKALPKDTSQLHQTNSKGLDLIAIGGLGMTTGSTFHYWEVKFNNNGPALTLGLEVPFTKSHIFSFEIYGHSWLCKSENDEFQGEYKKISNNLYSQWGISTVVKCFLGKVTQPFRVSVHFGFMVISPTENYKSLDIGFGLYYKILNDYTISLNSSILTRIPNFVETTQGYTPNLLILNINYKFNLRF